MIRGGEQMSVKIRRKYSLTIELPTAGIEKTVENLSLQNLLKVKEEIQTLNKELSTYFQNNFKIQIPETKVKHSTPAEKQVLLFINSTAEEFTINDIQRKMKTHYAHPTIYRFITDLYHTGKLTRRKSSTREYLYKRV